MPGYFHRVNRHSPTRFWINNPTVDEADRAIAAGAVGCTTNPTFAAKMVSDGSMQTLLEEICEQHADPAAAAAAVQRKLAARVMERFALLHEKSHGTAGYVSIQCDPLAEDDPNAILTEAEHGRKLGANFIAKIPVTASGLVAIEALAAEGVPIIATEVMSIAQVTAVCETYASAVAGRATRPPLYVTHITGIFDKYLASHVEREGIAVSRDALWHAGLAVAQKQYRLMKERGYDGIVLGGGARDLHHFTEFVGADVHVTINWKGTADRLIKLDGPVVYRFSSRVPEHYLDGLFSLPDFRSAYLNDGLEVGQFAEFGPVADFRDSFVAGWRKLLACLPIRR